MLTIAELPEYQKKVSGCLTPKEQADLIDYLAVNPDVGDLIQGTGGLRKIRWSTQSDGKRGGARVIYYYYNDTLPLYLITVYKKSGKVDLTNSERHGLAKLVTLLKEKGRVG